MEASEIFNNAFNIAAIEVEFALGADLIAPNNSIVRAAFASAISLQLNAYVPGSSFITGSCAGNYPQSTAKYCN